MSKLDLRSQVIDALRILAWNQYSQENPNQYSTILEWYQEFKQIWDVHEFHSMTLTEIMNELPGYSIETLIKFRIDYYKKKANFIKFKEQKMNLEKIYLNS
ncbi:MAG: hypothetical protein RLZZ338_1432 [Cyanobacteriota bacterium]|jgi:hypothetical protein